MAQALLEQKLDKTTGGGLYLIESGGLLARDGQPASPEAIEVMSEKGIDLSYHRSMGLKESQIKYASLILTMGASHRDYIRHLWPEKSNQTYTICEFVGDASKEVLDPFGLGMEAYRACYAQLTILIDELFNKIIESK